MKEKIKKILPNYIYILITWVLHPKKNINKYRKVRDFKRELQIAEFYHKEALNTLRNKESIRCVFFALYDSIWKCDTVYRKMQSHERFTPIILVCPVVNKGHEHMLEEMRRSYKSFKDKGYTVLSAYNQEKNTYIDVLKDLSPDIIVYTNPYKGLIDDRYYIDKFKSILTIYIPYYINGTINNAMAYNQPVHNLVWKYYVESSMHKSLAVQYSFAKGKNVFVAGYPGIEDFVNGGNGKKYNRWKIENRKIKRIIWAPHQTITPVGNVNYSCFMSFYKFMIQMAEKYSDKVQFIFKPHPLLKGNLYKKWGKEKTDEYYDKWENMFNTNVEYGDYHNLFISSDAMIHDCGSFTAEYLYLNKPVMRVLNNVPLDSMFGRFGLECIANHYQTDNERGIEQFIINVISGFDPLKEQRTKFVNEVLMPKGSPSQSIIDDILYSIDNQVLYHN